MSSAHHLHVRAVAVTAFLLLAGSLPALGAKVAATISIHTTNDDLRAGSSALVVLRMTDLSEQEIPITAGGERLADNTSKDIAVGPRAPMTWGDVRELGIRFLPDPGGGMRQADDWRMSFQLFADGCPVSGSPPPLTLCVRAGGTAMFEGDGGKQTSWHRVSLSGNQCARDPDCDTDALFCNRLESQCRASAGNASVRVCTRGTGLIEPCPGQVCDERQKQCVRAGCVGSQADADGDGVRSSACGGTDCDDTNRRRFPGNAEVCDSGGLDEDCNFSTIGNRDTDGDGFVDALCWNDVTQRANRSVPEKR